MQLALAVAELVQERVYGAPSIELEDGTYVVRFARNVEEVEAALKLRFEVFNLELGEGLDSSFQTGRDRDEFDATSHHLIVREKATGNVVGTYRLRTMEMAGSVQGFYSAGEFDLSCLPSLVLNASVELGRACISQSHRNRQVLFLLWKGLALYAMSERKRFLFGCCSLTSQDESEGHRMLDHLTRNGHMHSTLFVLPRAGYECGSGSSASSCNDSIPGSAGILPAGASYKRVKVPRLFDTYLEIGAKVCGPPAIDREFKTIDFLVMFDIKTMDAKTRRLFFTV